MKFKSQLRAAVEPGKALKLLTPIWGLKFRKLISRGVKITYVKNSGSGLYQVYTTGSHPNHYIVDAIDDAEVNEALRDLARKYGRLK